MHEKYSDGTNEIFHHLLTKPRSYLGYFCTFLQVCLHLHPILFPTTQVEIVICVTVLESSLVTLENGNFDLVNSFEIEDADEF